jgi:hypothetical protein
LYGRVVVDTRQGATRPARLEFPSSGAQRQATDVRLERQPQRTARPAAHGVQLLDPHSCIAQQFEVDPQLKGQSLQDPLGDRSPRRGIGQADDRPLGARVEPRRAADGGG